MVDTGFVDDSSDDDTVQAPGVRLQISSEDMHDEEKRLESYARNGWPDWVPVGYDKLAKAGFYYEGNGDEVVCPFCCGRVHGWQYGDTAMLVHRLNFGTCPFVLDVSGCGNIPLRNFRNRSASASSGAQSGRRPASATSNRRRDTSASSANIFSGDSSLNQSGHFGDSLRSRSSNHSPSTGAGVTGTSPSSGYVSANASHDVSDVQHLPVDMKREADRLRTFTSWTNMHVLPDDLAHAGFYYCNTGDMVKCAFCGVRLNEWKRGESPMHEHIRHRATCDFLVSPDQVGNEPLPPESRSSISLTNLSSQTLPSADPFGRLVVGSHSHRAGMRASESTPDVQFFASRQRHVQTLPPPQANDHDSSFATTHSLAANIKSPDDDYRKQMGALNIYVEPVSCPEMAELGRRLQSFCNWPNDHPQKPEQLAKAGFYSYGEEDTVKCFHCDGGLKEWLPEDDAWEEHARYFPKCEFVRICRGENFIQNVERKFAEGQEKSDGSPLRNEIYRVVFPDVKLAVPRTLNQLRAQGVDIQNDVTDHALEMGFSEEEICRAIHAHDRLPFLGVSSLVQAIEDLKLEDRKSPNSTQSTLDETDDSIPERHQCKICTEREICILFLPCGHLCCCELCAPALTLCPICRTEKKASVRAFMP